MMRIRAETPMSFQVEAITNQGGDAESPTESMTLCVLALTLFIRLYSIDRSCTGRVSSVSFPDYLGESVVPATVPVNQRIHFPKQVYVGMR